MPYKLFKYKQEVNAVDIQGMTSMSHEDYREYLESGLFFIDHHDILRSGPAEYPIACTKAQITALIDYLNEIKGKLK